jgi:hypothetical protein
MKNSNLLFTNRPISEVFYKHLANGVSVFTYKDYIVRIVYNRGEYLRLGCSNDDALQQLIVQGNNIMNSNIIAYYLMDSEDFSELLPSVEWHNNPTQRQKELREADKLGFKCHNLRLYDESYNSNLDKAKVKKRKMSLF